MRRLRAEAREASEGGPRSPVVASHNASAAIWRRLSAVAPKARRRTPRSANRCPRSPREYEESAHETAFADHKFCNVGSRVACFFGRSRETRSGAAIAQPSSMNPFRKRFVYLLRSLDGANRPYVGLTSNVPARLGFHNAGLSPHTARHRPWELVVSIEFPDEQRAVTFEKYLKSGSGRARDQAAEQVFASRLHRARSQRTRYRQVRHIEVDCVRLSSTCKTPDEMSR